MKIIIMMMTPPCMMHEIISNNCEENEGNIHSLDSFFSEKLHTNLKAINFISLVRKEIEFFIPYSNKLYDGCYSVKN